MSRAIHPDSKTDPLYQKVADQIACLIQEGVLRPGERVSSLRKVSEQYGVSLTTAIQAFILLEDRGLVEARPKSGFFVKVQAPVLKEPTMAQRPRRISVVTVGALQSRLFEAAMLPHVLALGGAVPSPELLPTVKLNRILASVARRAGKSGISYDMPPGSESLRREIAKRAMNAGAT
ncbi:MAG: GntR family transcriptional regulator, partial [Prosthecobacter sp.]|nr:GntR family transcriptional regulator [Prosthecobacter sp.]